MSSNTSRKTRSLGHAILAGLAWAAVIGASAPVAAETLTPAWSSPSDTSLPDPEPPQVTDVAILADGRLVTVGSQSVVVDAALSATVVPGVGASDRILPWPSGGDVRWNKDVLYRVDGDQRLVWSIDCRAQGGCLDAVIGADEHLLVLHGDVDVTADETDRAYRLHSYDERGTRVHQGDDVTSGIGPRLIRDTVADRVYLLDRRLGPADAQPPVSTLVVQSFDLNGRLVGDWQSPEGRFYQHPTSVALADGGIELAVSWRQAADDGQSDLLRFGAGGDDPDIIAITGIELPQPSGFLLTGQGGGFVTETPRNYPAEARIQALSADGAAGAAVALPYDPALRTSAVQWQALSGGDLVIAYGEHGQTRVVRASAAGEPLYSTLIPGAAIDHGRPIINELADGDLRILTARHQPEAGEPTMWLNGIAVVDSAGAVTGQADVPPLPPAPQVAHSDLVTTPSGIVVGLLGEPRQGAQVNGWSSTGEHLWHSSAASAPSVSAATRHRLHECGDDRVCVLTDLATTVLDVPSGAVVATLPAATTISARDDGGWFLIDSHEGCSLGGICILRHQRITVDADGTSVQSHAIHGTPLRLADNGAVLAIDDDHLYVLAPDGEETPYLPDQPFSIPAVQPASGFPGQSSTRRIRPAGEAWFDGQDKAFVLQRRCSTLLPVPCLSLALLGLSADGIQWLLDTGISSNSTVTGQAFQTDADGNHLLLVRYNTVRQSEWSWLPSANDRLYLAKFTADGEQLWQRHWLSGGFGDSQLLQYPEHDALVVARPDPERSQLVATVLDADSGDLRDEHTLRCPEGDCSQWRAAASGKQTLVALGIGRDHAVAIEADIPLTQAPAIALGQTALNGAWYAPRSRGQGFNLRIYPETSPGQATLFMPWFTFDQLAGNDTANLRWYALQADVANDDVAVEIPILQTRDGQFLHAGYKQTIVGQARLRFPSCTAGLLDYRFDDGPLAGSGGTIALNRLLPAGGDCIEADGSARPATAVADSAISGTWYDPAVPGQGLDVQYLFDDSDDDGILFGTWHAYDPVTPNNAPADQHWFTVQSAAVIDGGVSGTLYQSLGSRIDGPATDNHFRVGEVDLLERSCDRLLLRYRFDDSDAAGDYRGLDGEIELYRLGNCPAI